MHSFSGVSVYNKITYIFQLLTNFPVVCSEFLSLATLIAKKFLCKLRPPMFYL